MHDSDWFLIIMPIKLNNQGTPSFDREVTYGIWNCNDDFVDPLCTSL